MKTMYTFFALLLICSQVFAITTPERIQQIKIKADSLSLETLFNHVIVDHTLTYPAPAGAFFIGNGQYRISINDSIFNTVSVAGQLFIQYHELGHIYLGHTEMDPAIKNHFEIELEADYFGAFLYRRFERANEEIRAFLDFIALRPTNPPGELRASIIKSIIFAP